MARKSRSSRPKAARLPGARSLSPIPIKDVPVGDYPRDDSDNVIPLDCLYSHQLNPASASGVVAGAGRAS